MKSSLMPELMFVYIGLLFLALLIIILIWVGKPKGILVHINSFIDTLEYIDFEDKGRIRIPYKKWTNHEERLLAQGQVLYSSSWLRWGKWKPIPLSFRVVDIKLPENIEIRISRPKDLEGYTPGYIMPMDFWANNTSFQLDITIWQTNKNLQLKEPQLVSFAIDFHYKVRRFIFFSSQHHGQKRYDFFIGPPLGEVWIGIDPGTSGSCIAAGAPGDAVTMQQIENEDRITPSVITVNKSLSPELLYSEDGFLHNDLYKYGDDADSEKSNERNIAFQSIKKLLGFMDQRVITFANKKEMSIDGKQLSTLLVRGLLADFKEHLLSNQNRYQYLFEENKKFAPKRIVVAVPNNYTATKIKDMLSCLKNSGDFSEIRYITEAEAVLCYYIYKHADLHPSSKTGLVDETVFVFDMGGATINTTIADTIMRKRAAQPFYEINIDSKIGYGIGGDTIDYCLIQTFYLYINDVSPFSINEKRNDLHHQRITTIQEAVTELKIKIINRYYQEKILVTLKEVIPEEIQDEIWETTSQGTRILLHRHELKEYAQRITGTLWEDSSLNNLWKLFYMDKDGKYPIFSSALFKELIYDSVKDAVQETLALSFQGGAFINTILFSGRSCQFPLIKEKVESTIRLVKDPKKSKRNINPAIVILDSQSLKTAVARGACWYGVHRNAIKLGPSTVNSTFGVKRTRSAHPKDIDFVELIKVGQTFQIDGQGTYAENNFIIKDAFNFDSNHVNFYQIMGSDALQILKKNQQHKFTRLASIPIEQLTKEIGMLVGANDKVECTVWTITDQCINLKNNIIEQEITDENQLHYTWLTP